MSRPVQPTNVIATALVLLVMSLITLVVLINGAANTRWRTLRTILHTQQDQIETLKAQVDDLQIRLAWIDGDRARDANEFDVTLRALNHQINALTGPTTADE